MITFNIPYDRNIDALDPKRLCFAFASSYYLSAMGIFANQNIPRYSDSALPQDIDSSSDQLETANNIPPWFEARKAIIVSA